MHSKFTLKHVQIYIYITGTCFIQKIYFLNETSACDIHIDIHIHVHTTVQHVNGTIESCLLLLYT
jgi:hypothetical protein